MRDQNRSDNETNVVPLAEKKIIKVDGIPQRIPIIELLPIVVRRKRHFLQSLCRNWLISRTLWCHAVTDATKEGKQIHDYPW